MESRVCTFQREGHALGRKYFLTLASPAVAIQLILCSGNHPSQLLCLISSQSTLRCISKDMILFASRAAAAGRSVRTFKRNTTGQPQARRIKHAQSLAQ